MALVLRRSALLGLLQAAQALLGGTQGADAPSNASTKQRLQELVSGTP